jgi:hypothetical protein
MDELSVILARQAGFKVDEHQNVTLNDQWCTLETKLLIQLVAGWCLEKNRRFLFAHQASREIAKDFGYQQDPKVQQK